LLDQVEENGQGVPDEPGVVGGLRPFRGYPSTRSIKPRSFQISAARDRFCDKYDNLVSMTRSKSKSGPPKKAQRAAAKRSRGYWLLQDAKARFSELVRKVRSEGPQHVTVHGRDEVVVIAAEEFRRLKGNATGQALIEAMQASPHRDVDIAPKREPMPVRDIPL
jgi:prevent-host-death family protein